MTEPVLDPSPEWQGILERGEVILWQGKPREAFYWRKEYNYGIVGALAVLAILLVSDEIGSMKLLLVLITPLILFGGPVWDAIRRHYSFFTLTDRRGIVGVDMPVLGRRLHMLRLSSHYPLTLEQSGSSSAVYFSEETRQGKHGKYQVAAGFEGLSLEDAEAVHRLICKALKDKP